MKAKYYPHVTVCGAAILFVAPLCFVLSLPYLRTPSDFDDAAFADSIIDATFAEETATIASSDTKSPARIDFSPASEVPTVAADPRATVKEQTRVAMRPSNNTPNVAEYAHPKPVIPIDDAVAVMDMASIENSTQPSESDVPIPRLAKSQLLEPDVMNQVATEPEAPAKSQVASVEPQGSKEEEFVEPNVTTGTHFDATSHLAMRGGALGASSSSKMMNGNAVNEIRNRVADSRTSAPMSAEEKRKLERSAAGLMSGVMPKEGAFGESPAAVVEEVILQQPLESRMVGRMENVVAVTRAKGWPVALVKSDLPDDQWWVQQMVGIRGNAFAARVNFGNQHSIRGSVYHLVFVFLDSPDEVRRFRIAKQFKDLPEGIRRSREYTFTRK